MPIFWESEISVSSSDTDDTLSDTDEYERIYYLVLDKIKGWGSFISPRVPQNVRIANVTPNPKQMT